MEILNIGGPDGRLLIEALVVSVLIALLAWRRAGLTAGILATAVVAVALVVVNAKSPDASPGLNFAFVRTLFIVVPAALLLGASRRQWIARHAWVLVLLGPVLFAGCYVGICALCEKAGVI